MSRLSLLVLALLAIGCAPPRLKSVEAYNSNRTPNESPTWGGDPHAFGGIGDGSGGVKAKTSFMTSSNSYDAREGEKTSTKGWKIGDDQRPARAMAKKGDDHGDHGGDHGAEKKSEDHSAEEHSGESHSEDSH